MDFGFRGGDAIIVTGAASGIGRATAAEAARQGLRVLAWDMNLPALSRAVVEITAEGGTAVPVGVDITDARQLEGAVEESGVWGVPRYLVNNAGPPSTAELALDDALSASVGATQRVTTAWLGMGELEGRAVVSVASITALVGAPGWYPVAKAAIAAYTRSLAVGRPGGIRANAVAPGLTDTPRTADLLRSDQGQGLVRRNPLARAARPEDVAHACLFLLSPAAAYVNGVTLVVDGGQTLVV